MGRQTRIHYSGALFHVIGRGNDQQNIFLDDHDRIDFLDRLARIKRETGFALYAYCLMTNHYHLFLRVANISLSEIMQRLLTGYSIQFNRKWGRRGHLFENRYKDIHCARDSYFRELVRYINMNPVAAGIVDSPEMWQWSGYQELFAEGPGIIDKEFLLSMFGGGPHAKSTARDFILKAESFDFSWIESDSPEVDRIEREISQAGRASLDELLSVESRRFDVAEEALLSKARTHPLSVARREFVVRAAVSGYRTAEIARFLKRCEPVVSRIIARSRSNRTKDLI